MLNHIVIMGRMTRDPELRRTASGTAVASFTLAVDRNFAAKDAQRETDFIDCVAWRSTGEFVSKYIDLHETKYGSDPELILITEEEEAAGNAERKRSEITRWLGYFDEKAKTGYYYGRAVSEIQGLGCHDYDTHFHESWILMWSKIQEKSWSERPLMGGKKQKDTFDMYIGALLC